MPDFLKYTFLYEFTLGSTIWRYTSNAEDVVDPDGFVWEATLISDDGVNQSGEVVSDNFTINCSVELPIARLWMYSTPEGILDVRVMKADFLNRVPTLGFSGVESAPASRIIPVINKRVRYVGEVAQCDFSSIGGAQFSVETISATMRRAGLHGKWQRQCEYMIYDPLNCKAPKAPNAIPCTVVSVSGRTAQVSVGLTSGALAGGLMEFTHPIKGPSVLTIESNNTSVVAIFGSVGDLYPGLAVTLYRGCDGTPAACQSHGNYPNYGGCPNLPGKSPFDGINNPLF